MFWEWKGKVSAPVIEATNPGSGRKKGAAGLALGVCARQSCISADKMMKISRSMCRYENRKRICGDEVLGKFNKKQ